MDTIKVMTSKDAYYKEVEGAVYIAAAFSYCWPFALSLFLLWSSKERGNTCKSIWTIHFSGTNYCKITCTDTPTPQIRES